jgi:fructose-1,6-bisphosphatase
MNSNGEFLGRATEAQAACYLQYGNPLALSVTTGQLDQIRGERDGR